MTTYLRYDYLTDLNKQETAAYIALKMLYDKNKILTRKVEIVELNFTIEQLYWEISGSFKPNRYDKEKLKAGLKELEEYEIVKILDTDGNSYVIDATSLYIHSVNNGDDSNDIYIKAEREEVRTVFNLNKGRNYGLLRFTMLLFSTLNNNEDKPYYKCGFMARETAVETFGLSGNQIYQDYFKELEDNNIIYVHHSKRTKIQESGGIKTLSNIYGRFDDKSYVDSYANYQEEEQVHDFRQLPDHAIVTRDYNKYCRKPENFSRDEAMKLYEFCKRYNDMPLQREGYIEKYELSVFPFYVGEIYR